MRVAATSATSTTSALQGGLTLVAMVGVAVALLVLGSLPAAYGSVWLALGSLADRRGVVHQDTRGRGRLTRLTVGTSRRAQGLLRSLPEVVKPLVVVALPALLAWWIVRVGVSTVAVWIVEQRVWLLAGAVACLVVGAVAALYLGDLLRPVTRIRREGVSELEWDYGPLVASAGVNASWSWLYGAGYFVVAFAVTWLGLEAASPAWVVALVVTALVLGVALTLGMPLVAPPLAIRGLERREHERDAGRPRFVVLDPVPVPERDAGRRGGSRAVRRVDRAAVVRRRPGRAGRRVPLAGVDPARARRPGAVADRARGRAAAPPRRGARGAAAVGVAVAVAAHVLVGEVRASPAHAPMMVG